MVDGCGELVLLLAELAAVVVPAAAAPTPTFEADVAVSSPGHRRTSASTLSRREYADASDIAARLFACSSSNVIITSSLRQCCTLVRSDVSAVLDSDVGNQYMSGIVET